MKVYFPLPLKTSQLNERWHCLDDCFQIIVQSGRAQIVIAVPTGFVTDFASVPRIPLAYLLVGGKGNRAAVLHDYLYQEARKPRYWCDNAFYAALLALAPDIKGWQAKVMYAGVRAGGWMYYGKHKDKPVIA